MLAGVVLPAERGRLNPAAGGRPFSLRDLSSQPSGRHLSENLMWNRFLTLVATIGLLIKATCYHLAGLESFGRCLDRENAFLDGRIRSLEPVYQLLKSMAERR